MRKVMKTIIIPTCEYQQEKAQYAKVHVGLVKEAWLVTLDLVRGRLYGTSPLSVAELETVAKTLDTIQKGLADTFEAEHTLHHLEEQNGCKTRNPLFEMLTGDEGTPQ